MAYKYMVLFPIRGTDGERILSLMDQVAELTGIVPPHYKLLPHVTFHRPIEGIDEQVLINLVRGMTLVVRQTRVRYNSLDAFGKHFVVLPVHGTRLLNTLWVGINSLLSKLPEYQHGPFDDDNTLHITVGAGLSDIFDDAWPRIRQIDIEGHTIPLDLVELHRKPVEGGRWELVEAFQIPQ